MLAYAANAPRHVERRSSPSAMLFIIAGHVAALAAVMAAKMDLPAQFHPERTVVTLIPETKPPEPEPRPQTQPPPRATNPVKVDPIIPVRTRDPVILQPTLDQQPPTIGDPAGTGTGQQIAFNIPKVEPVRTGPRFATPDWALKPPYPAEKLRLEQEASLRLRLTIDASGHVVAVEPVGTADPVFLAAARKHLIAKWRYKPATEDGRAVTSTTVITLRFQLDNAA